MNHFEAVHHLAAERRLRREDEPLPMERQRQRIAELEGALLDLIRTGDSLKLPAKELDRWHGAALAAEGVLRQYGRQLPPRRARAAVEALDAAHKREDVEVVLNREAAP
jgi:hypothetical protein